jgi:hypothetical protein
MVFIYTLKLTQGKYYVGKTTNSLFITNSNLIPIDAEWIMKYSPYELLDFIPNCDEYDEDKYTIKYMDMYGINNVRGGSFISIELNSSTIQHLNLMSKKTIKEKDKDKYVLACESKPSASNKEDIEVKYCTLCEKDGHYATNCVTLTMW